MSEVLGNATKIVIDVDKGGPMIYLPLDQLNRARAGEPGDAAPTGPGTRPEASSGDSRARDKGGR